VSTEIPINTDLLREARQAIVAVREHWGDEWQVIPHLYANWVSWAANPSVSSAQLDYEYGRGMRQGEAAFSNEDKLYLDRWFVKVACIQNDETIRYWHGVILENVYAPIGPVITGETRAPAGHQALMAYGLEVLLDREPITTSVFKSLGGEPTRTGRALEPNREDKHKTHGEMIDSGNMSIDPLEENGVYLFAGDPAESKPWNTRELVRYLLTYHAPGVFESGTPDIVWEIDEASEAYLPTWDKPHVQLQDRTVKEVLDSILDRRRLLGYRVEVTFGEESSGEGGTGVSEVVLIRPFQYTDEAITFTDGWLGPNEDQKTFDFDTMRDLSHVVVRRSVSHKYDAVIARGARVLCCGTFSAIDGTLAKGWSDEQKAGYIAGASEAEDYNTIEPYQRFMRNAQARAADKFERVYSYFTVPAIWNGHVLGGETNESADLFPYSELSHSELNVDSGLLDAWFLPEMRFERFIPLKVDHDYSADLIGNEAIVDGTPDDMQWEYLRPLVAIKLPPDPDPAGNSSSSAQTPRYGQVEKLAAAADIETMGQGMGRFNAYSVRIQHEAPGIALNCSGGPAHSLADDYTAAPGDTLDVYIPELNWKDNLLATLAARADYNVQSRYPRVGYAASVLTIDVGDKAELHYVAPQTVVGVVDGLLVRSTSGGFVRDDRKLLADVARAAFEWYGVERQSLTMVWNQADLLGLNVGDLIIQIGGAIETMESVRTVVTELRLQFAATEHDSESCTMQTHWGELDVLRML
jgi:hypothetical protein